MDTVTATSQRVCTSVWTEFELTDDVNNNQEQEGIFTEHPDLTDGNHDRWKNDSRGFEDYGHYPLLRWLHANVPGSNK